MAFLNVIDKFILSRWYYKKGEPFISDAEYNELCKSITALRLAPEYTGRTWSEDPEPTELLLKYREELPRLSGEAVIIPIEDSNAEPDEINIITDSMETLSSKMEVVRYTNGNLPRRLSIKLDGWSVQVKYFNTEFKSGRSRGRASDPIDLSGIEYVVPSKITKGGNVTIVGELVLSDANFKILSKELPELELVSSRSSIRTAMSRGYENLTDFIAFTVYVGRERCDCKTAYDFLKANGFKTPDYIDVYDMETFDSKYSQLEEMGKTCGLPSDGAVWQGLDDNSCVAIRMGIWENPIYRSFVTGYKPNHGEHSISTCVEIYPIVTSHGRQTEVSVYNLSYVKDYKLYIGSPIAFELRSKAVAVLKEDITMLLHKEFDGRFNEYAENIKDIEFMKGCDNM